MAEHRRSGKLAVILHADIVGSTELVHRDEQLAHARIQETFHRFSDTIKNYNGKVRELRGDALLAEFDRASDAVTAALLFQATFSKYNSQLNDSIQPAMRVGIAMGEVVIADETITGVGVVLAQRLEQLAESGSVVIQGAAYETIPGRFPFEFANLGEHKVKGLGEPVRAYEAKLKVGAEIPQPSPAKHRIRNSLILVCIMAVIAVSAVLLWFKPWEQPLGSAPSDRIALSLPSKPSVAILPFDNLGNDPDQSYFADGLTDDLITNLSLYRELFVIARNSTFVYKGKAVDVKQIGRDLGVAFVVEGSVRRENNRVRINAQLIDAQSGNHVWAERFDRQFSDVFAIQDEITRSIAGRLAPEITRVGIEESRNKPTEDLDAWDLYLQATAALAEFNRKAEISGACPRAG